LLFVGLFDKAYATIRASVIARIPLRWWIGGLLFASTVINYIDRQSLSVLAPYLKIEYGWSNEQFARLVIAFRIAYAVGQPIMGRVVDYLGTRNGLTLSVVWYSLAAMLTPLANGLGSLSFFRFLLGLGEAANWPGNAKAVGEWFPSRERGWAVALYDSGSAIGAAIAPFLVIGLYHYFGSWRPAFFIPGLLGILWLIVWRRLYYSPERHPSITAAERELIVRDREQETITDAGVSWRQLLKLPQTWGLIFGKALTDPVWFFVTDWFAIYLVSKKIPLEQGILAFWIPFLAADIGNFLGGGVSSWLIKRGWSVIAARKAVIQVTGLGMTLLAFSIYTTNLYMLAFLFSISTCCYAAWSTMALTLPADIYPRHWVASVSGMTGAGAGIGTIISTFLIGRVTDRYSFEPVLIVASLIPLVATILVTVLVRHRKAVSA
jgi:ACS family hexuronate transporter-like MFS transporter